MWFLVLSYVLLMTKTVTAVCDEGWIQNGLYCYFFSSSLSTQEEAKSACQANYASLAFIDDDGENMFLYENGPALTLQSYWIGYVRVFGSIWRWTATGSAGAYRKWDLGEPDGEGGCARMTPYVLGVWRDWECQRLLGFICKKFADCGSPGEMELGTLSVVPDITPITPTTAFPRDAEATFTCVDGAEYDNEAIEKTSVCSLGGIWKPDLIETGDICKWKSCPSPPLFEEHMITNATEDTRAFGTIVYYKCADGYWFNQYELGVTKYLTCQDDKTWTGDGVVACSEIYCVRPVTSFARASTPLNEFGTEAVYTCDPGYKYADNTTEKTFVCGSNGWIPPPEPCIEKRCPEFSLPDASPSTDSRAVFTTVIWSCDAGMRFPDTTTRKSMYCKDDESWNRIITDQCERKKCEGTPPNASETYSHNWNISNGEVYRFGDQITYTCIPEWYFADGSPTKQLTCNADGIWAPQVVPDCLGEIIEVKHGVTHPPVESEKATTVVTLAYIIISIVLGIMVFLDAVTIGKHIAVLKSNVCPPKDEEEGGETTDKIAHPLTVTDV